MAFISAAASPLPFHSAYRAGELAVAFVAIVAAVALFGERAGHMLVRLALGTVAALTGLVWFEAFAMPSQAWIYSRSTFGVPYIIHGVLPQFSSNTVGSFGALLAIWGMASPGETHTERIVARLAVPVGLATVVAAQYRTGIIGVLLCGAVILWFRGRYAITFVALVAGLVLVGLNAQAIFVSGAENVISRGQSSTLVYSLDSRTTFWKASIPFIEQRPLDGWGLNAGSRKVLANLGRSDTSTIHGTWVEAALGTGVIGAGVLALAMLSALRLAWRVRRHPLGLAIFGMLIFYLVRSLTGSTIELFDSPFLLFAALVVGADSLGSRLSHDVSTEG
jgi:O-antigen ligase